MKEDFKVIRNFETIDSKKPDKKERVMEIKLPPELTEDKFRYAIAKLIQVAEKEGLSEKDIEILKTLQASKFKNP
ncbi:MAG: hypothetical protein WA055_04665 [Candidatus Moraniibacteriota bacterium]